MPKKTLLNCPVCKRQINWIQIVVMRAEDEAERGHAVRVYACPRYDCEAILGVVPEPDDYLVDAVSAAEAADASAQDAGAMVLAALAGKKKRAKK